MYLRKSLKLKILIKSTHNKFKMENPGYSEVKVSLQYKQNLKIKK